MILLPAYGRDYKSKRAVLADFNTGKDFACREYNKSDCYINKQQINDREQLTFRYDKQTKVFIMIYRKEK